MRPKSRTITHGPLRIRCDSRHFVGLSRRLVQASKLVTVEFYENAAEAVLPVVRASQDHLKLGSGARTGCRSHCFGIPVSLMTCFQREISEATIVRISSGERTKKHRGRGHHPPKSHAHSLRFPFFSSRGY